jgi:hypothetical protein
LNKNYKIEYKEDESGFEHLKDGGTCIRGTLPMERPTDITKKQEFMATTTDWVTETLFSDRAFMQKYVQQFQCFYNKHVGAYLDAKNEDREKCVLIFKGGNVIVNYIADIAEHSDVFKPLITKSDIDFLVYAPDESFFNEHMGEITKRIVKAVYDQLAWLRSQTQMISLNTVQLPKYTKDNENAVRETRLDTFILNKDSEVLNEVGASIKQSGVNQCASIILQRDALLSDVKPKNTSGVPAQDPMYVTYNDTLRFKMRGVANGVAKFNLVRIKYNVKLFNDRGECWMRVPGEVLDVSISLPDDFKIQTIKNEDLDVWTRRRKDGIRVPTIKYLAYHDLHNILFEEQEFPWHDIKYEKRLARLVLLLQLIELGADELDDSQLYHLNPKQTKSVRQNQLNASTDLILKFSEHTNIENLVRWISDVQQGKEVPTNDIIHGPFGKLREWISEVKCKIDKLKKDTNATMSSFDIFLSTCVHLLMNSTAAVHSYFTKYVEDYYECNNANNASTTRPPPSTSATSCHSRKTRVPFVLPKVNIILQQTQRSRGRGTT